MGKRKVSILEQAATAVAEIAFFIEGKGMPLTAKKFVDDAFAFFEKISIDTADHRLCDYKRWQDLGYQCIHYKKKYVVAYLSLSNEIIICDFVAAKLLKE
jgi:hypothetical protein